DAGLDGQVLAQRDNVERRIVERTVEDQAAAIDRELLAECEISAVDGAYRAAPDQRARGRRGDAHASAEARLDAFAPERERAPEIDVELERQWQVARLGFAARQRRPALDHDVRGKLAGRRRLVFEMPFDDRHLPIECTSPVFS